MRKIRLGRSDLDVSRIGYGCMMIGGTWDTEPITASVYQKGESVIRTALDLGINFFDHADIYCFGKSETVFSRVLKTSPSLRPSIMIQSKCGIVLGGIDQYDFSYEHIIASAEGSLRRLGTDYLDVFLLHRPDPLVEPEEVAKAFRDLKEKGKVRWFGVSNHTPGQIELLQKYLTEPIITNQIEFNPIYTNLLDQGVNFNHSSSLSGNNLDAIEYCRMRNITLQAWSPLAQGRLSGRVDLESSAKFAACSRVVMEMAEEKMVKPEAIILAWILRHPARIQPIPGVTNIERLVAACEADSIELTRDEWYRIYIAGRGESLP
jgi:predicted oxidoreductase